MFFAEIAADYCHILPLRLFTLLLPQSATNLSQDGPRGRWVTYPGFPEIKASASRGCAFCPLYLEALEEMFDEQGRPLDPKDDWGERFEWDPWPKPHWNRVVAISHPVFPRRRRF